MKCETEGMIIIQASSYNGGTLGGPWQWSSNGTVLYSKIVLQTLGWWIICCHSPRSPNALPCHAGRLVSENRSGLVDNFVQQKWRDNRCARLTARKPNNQQIAASTTTSLCNAPSNSVSGG